MFAAVGTGSLPGRLITSQDMHYADFAEDEVCRMMVMGKTTLVLTHCDQGAALLSAIKEYEASKWKIIGQKVGKPPKVGSLTTLTDPVDGLTQSRPANNMQRSILVAGYDASLIFAIRPRFEFDHPCAYFPTSFHVV